MNKKYIIFLSLSILVLAISITIYSFVFYWQAPDNLGFQKRCSDQVAKFIDENDFRKNQGFNYQNHYNLKLGKCFVLVSSYDANTDFRTIDLYDAFEAKHYAEFDGHDMCDPLTLAVIGKDQKYCQLNSGNVWLNGNDNASSSDVHFGFVGVINGGIGNADTERDFNSYVQSFLNN